MTLSLTKRIPLGRPITAAEFDANMTAIEGAANAGAVSVKDPQFGAKGDGATDDVTAIRAAHAAAGVGGAVYYPAGTYLVSGAIVLSDQQTVRGEGWATTVRLKAGSNSDVYQLGLTNTTRTWAAQILDIQIDGNRSGQTSGTGRGLAVDRAFRVVLSNVRVAACRGDGVALLGSGTGFENYLHACSLYGNGGWGLSVAAAISDCHALGCDIGFNDAGGVVLPGASSLESCVVWGGGVSGGVALTPASVGVKTNGNTSQIRNCNIEGFGKQGVWVAGNNLISVIGCKLTANGSAGDKAYSAILVDGTTTGVDGFECLATTVYSNVVAGTPRHLYQIEHAGTHFRSLVSACDLRYNGNFAVETDRALVSGVAASDTVQIPPRATGGKTAAFTLSFLDNGATDTATGTWTLTVPSAATLGDGFTYSLANVGAGTITVDGPGASNPTVAAAQVATLYVANGNVLVSTGATSIV